MRIYDQLQARPVLTERCHALKVRRMQVSIVTEQTADSGPDPMILVRTASGIEVWVKPGDVDL